MARKFTKIPAEEKRSVGAPRKAPGEKVVKLNSVTIPGYQWNYLLFESKIRDCRVKDVLVAILEERISDHPNEDSLNYQRNHIRQLSADYKFSREILASENNKKFQIATNMLNAFIERHYGEKITKVYFDKYIELVNNKTRLGIDRLEVMYHELQDKYVADVEAGITPNPRET